MILLRTHQVLRMSLPVDRIFTLAMG